MLTNRLLAELVTDLHNGEKDPQVQNVVKLAEILIAEARIDNDTATPERVLKNQGKIEGFLSLVMYIQRGLPGVQKSA
jgi:hypothetical protein